MRTVRRCQWVGILVVGFLGGLACSGKSEPSTVDLLPANKSVESWGRPSVPTIVKGDSALYAQIDGAAPKYIYRGWVSSVYATYAQNGMSMQVAIADMGTAENARGMFNFELPVSRMGLNEPLTAVVDMGLTAAYRSIAYSGQYFIEVTIDDRSDAALASIKAFTLKILSR